MAIKGKQVKRVRRVRKASPDAVGEITTDEIADIVRTLEYTIEALKSADCPPGCNHIKPLIEIYEWALGEFKQAGDGRPVIDAERIAALRKLLNIPLG
jgi:signal recognition particle subunit SEC65